MVLLVWPIGIVKDRRNPLSRALVSATSIRAKLSRPLAFSYGIDITDLFAAANAIVGKRAAGLNATVLPAALFSGKE